jgi:hypothetical protein
MSESDIRTAIKTVLSGVADIGQVHDYERWTASDAEFISVFKTTVAGVDQVRAWLIRRKGPVNEDQGGVAVHGYIIDGYLSVKDADATEKTLNALIEAVRAAFRANVTLNGSCIGADFLIVNAIDVRMLGAVMCHHAELALTVYEEL